MEKLSGINLNLLSVLDELLKEQNVSAAAKKLNLTQPTISNSLKQLREIFNDELLIRGPRNKMLLTYKARELVNPVSKAIAALGDVFNEKKVFNPNVDKYHFNIGMSDYASVICLPKIMQEIRDYDENISITVKHLNNFWSYEDFIQTDIDLAIGNYTAESEKLIREDLFISELVCIANKKHPAFQGNKLSKEDFFKYKHIWVFYKKEYWEEVSNIIQNIAGCERKIPIQIPHLLVSLSLVENSDYICLSPDKLAEKFKKKYNLAIRKSPIRLPENQYWTFWSKTEENNPAIEWLKALIHQISF